MKIDRLLSITIYLLNHKKTSGRSLAERYNVSYRTILRDIDTLCMAGIPIVSTSGIDGGYEILDTFKMEHQIAGENDYKYIISALQGFYSAYNNEEVDTVIEKMKSVSGKSSSNIMLDFGVLQEHDKINNKIKILDDAIKRKKVVSLNYVNSKDDCGLYDVEPVSVIYKWYNWYLLCFYMDKKQYRIFKLQRMKDIIVTDKMAGREHNTEEALKKWENQPDKRKYINVKLLCKANVKEKCLEYIKGNIKEELGNGDVIIEFTVPEGEFFWYGAILALGENVKILKPQSLKDKVCNTCRAILKLYDNM